MSEERRDSKVPILAICIILLTVVYLFFPLFLLYPIAKPFGNSPPESLRQCVQMVFFVPITMTRKFPWYKGWLDWQMKVTGIR